MNEYKIVVGIVKFKERILIMKIDENRKWSPGLWEGVAGFIEEGETEEKAIIREVKEETDLHATIIEEGDIFESHDEWGHWKIKPFLVTVSSDKVKLNPKEHTDFKWVKLEEIKGFDCVKDMEEDLKRVGLLK